MKTWKTDEPVRWMRRIGLVGQKPSVAIFFFFAAFYYFTNAGWYKAGDEFFMIQVARQMVSKGRIGFEVKELPQELYYEEYIIKGPDGLYYTKWGLGQSLVEVPFIFLHRLTTSGDLPTYMGEGGPGAPYHSEWMFLILCPSLISAVGCVLVYCLGRRLGFSERVSMVLCVVYGLCTMAWPYSKSLMSEGTLNVAMLGGVYSAVRYVGEKRWHWVAISGACMGFAVVTKITSLLIAPLIVAYILASLRTKESLRRVLLFFAPPFCAFLVLQAYHNFTRYGSFWEWGYNAGRDALGFCTPLTVGLWGLLASPGKSFFLYAPTTLLGLLCLRSFLRHRRKEALLGLSICVVFTLLHARWWAWAGDWAWGPRFLLVITPYILLPCGILLERWNRLRRLQRLLAMALIFLSLGIQFLGVSVHPFSYTEVRARALGQLMSPGIDFGSYRGWYTESALAHFSPLFSHIAGNFWLCKHMYVDYDLWGDVPWKSLGNFDLEKPMWVRGNRTTPFWWPVGIPLRAPSSGHLVRSLAVVNFLVVLWFGLGLVRLFRNRSHERLPGSSYLFSTVLGSQGKDK